MKTLFRRTLLSAALALATLPAVAQSTPDSPFTQTVFFGDSLTDAGFFRPLLPLSVRPVTGQFTPIRATSGRSTWRTTTAPPPTPTAMARRAPTTPPAAPAWA